MERKSAPVTCINGAVMWESLNRRVVRVTSSKGEGGESGFRTASSPSGTSSTHYVAALQHWHLHHKPGRLWEHSAQRGRVSRPQKERPLGLNEPACIQPCVQLEHFQILQTFLLWYQLHKCQSSIKYVSTLLSWRTATFSIKSQTFSLCFGIKRVNTHSLVPLLQTAVRGQKYPASQTTPLLHPPPPCSAASLSSNRVYPSQHLGMLLKQHITQLNMISNTLQAARISYLGFLGESRRVNDIACRLFKTLQHCYPLITCLNVLGPHSVPPSSIGSGAWFYVVSRWHH